MKLRNKRIYGSPDYLRALHEEYRYYSGFDTEIKGDYLIVYTLRKTKPLSENQLRKERGLPTYY